MTTAQIHALHPHHPWKGKNEGKEGKDHVEAHGTQFNLDIHMKELRSSESLILIDT